MAKKKEEKELTGAELFREELGKFFGKSNIPINNDFKDKKIAKFSSGSLKLDRILKGGIPKGKVTELYGPEASGKSTLCLHSASSHQKQFSDEPVLWLDLEDVFDPIYAKAIGVDVDDPDRFIYAQPNTGEDCFEVMRRFSSSFKGGLIIVDSVALLLPAKESAGDMGDAQMGAHARLMSQGMRMVMPLVRQNGTTIIFINQIRDKIGAYGDPTATPGGKALAFYCRTRIVTGKSKGEEGVSTVLSMRLKKANYGHEGAKTDVEIIYGAGFDWFAELRDIALEEGLISKSGSWFSYGDTRLGQGAIATADIFRDNPELVDEIVSKLKSNGVEI
jgi:recombination protein RecA